MENFVKNLIIPVVITGLFFLLASIVGEIPLDIAIPGAVLLVIILAVVSWTYLWSGRSRRAKFSSQTISQKTSLDESHVTDSAIIQGNIVENMHITIDSGTVKRSPTVAPIADDDKRSAQVQNAGWPIRLRWVSRVIYSYQLETRGKPTGHPIY